MATDGRERVLICWGYHRSGWNEVFERIYPRFDFHSLFFFSPRLSRGRKPNWPVSYWTDYRTPQEIIARLKPQAIVFMGLDAPNTIALNMIAKRAGIPTVYLQHGFLMPLEQVEAVKARDVETGPSEFSLTLCEKIHQLKLFLSAVSWNSLDSIPFLIKWQLEKRKLGTEAALARNPSRHRLADHYLVYTIAGALPFLRDRDRVPVERLIEVGNPHLDQYFSRNSVPSEPPYEVFVDQPIYGSPELPMAIKTHDEVKALYHRLADSCADRGVKLIVKLHPFSYREGPRITHPSISFLEDCTDLAGLLLQSRVVYGYFSTLLLPALYLKPCCLFDIGVNNELQTFAARHGLATVVPFGHLPKFSTLRKEKPADGRDALRKAYIYREDGKSSERIAEFLQKILRRS